MHVIQDARSALRTATLAAFAVSLVLATSRSAMSQDVGDTLRVSKTAVPDEVELSWMDSSPTVYCIFRAAMGPTLPVVDSTTELTYLDTTPAAPVNFYSVEEPASGVCGSDECGAAAMIACGDSVSGNNSDAGSTDAADDYGPCGLTGATGPELTYGFRATADVTLTASLSGLSADLDVLVLEDVDGCDPLDCLARGDTEATFDVAAGTDYFIVVDGVGDAVSDYTLSLSCTSEDCPSVGVVGCGGMVTADTTDAGSTDLLEDYSPCGPANATGPEVSYQLVFAVDGPVTVTLTTAVADLTLLVTEDPTGAGCRASDCIASDDDGDGEVTFPGTAGTTYHLVVDGLDGASGAFTLEADCGSVMESICDPSTVLLCGGRAGRGNTSDPDMGAGDGISDAIDSYPCEPGRDMSGPELTFMFVPPGSGTVDLALTPSAGVELDLFVLQGACAPGGCIASGDTTLSFEAEAGETYFLVVDGRDGAMGAFSLMLTCDFPPTDCAPAGSLACGEFIFGNNGNAGSSMVNDAYTGCPGAPADSSGPEIVYQFVKPPIGMTEDIVVTAGFDFAPAELDVFITRGDCNPGSCVAWGDEDVTFTALADEQYFVIVDGRDGVSADYRVFIDPETCTRAPMPCMPLPEAVACGDTLVGESNGEPGSTTNIDSYPICSIARVFEETGPEVAYELTAESDGPVTVELTNVTGGIVHLYVLQDGTGECLAENCIQMGVFSATFDAVAGTTYYIVVDGNMGDVATYDISFTCD